MMTYVVTLNLGQFHDYCRIHRLHPAAAKFVQSAADLDGIDLDRNRFVFYGGYQRLPDIRTLFDRLLVVRAA
jgi:hypothetical protein